MLWAPLLVFSAVAVGITTAVSFLSAKRGWTVASRQWPVLAAVGMWAPALARLVTRRTVDRAFCPPFPLRKWGTTGWRIVAMPLLLPLAAYGTAYAAAAMLGRAHWSPAWDTPTRIVVNVFLNLSLLAVLGTFNAMGEEVGWRGYLQPRLDAAGVRGSVLVVAFVETVFHLPVMLGSGYLEGGALSGRVVRFAAINVTLAYLWAAWCYRASSVWPAILSHSLHNTVSQWLFPRLFAGGDDEVWLGESGWLPVGCYALLAASLWRGRMTSEPRESQDRLPPCIIEEVQAQEPDRDS